MSAFYRTASFLGFGLLANKNLQQLQKIEGDVSNLFSDMVERNGGNIGDIKSQIGQDVFALYILNWKKGGYFLEFGATNGIDLSNTYLLEKDFGWMGILAEPAKVWHADLKINRSASVDFDCVWSKSGEVINFTVAPEAEYSTISSFTQKDSHASARNKGETYPVKTISLNDLLVRHQAPSKIDYLSIDTEGSELEILEAFDFDKYAISVITCEHNFSSQRSKIYDLLTSQGFIRVFEGFSRWDDWYIHPKNIEDNQIVA
ncbi:FkbM family methyltransferase [Polynucleobacter paneuropaeus]|nr:FkbM family methyltransferase [Polynucleobacter paneuropaeus]